MTTRYRLTLQCDDRPGLVALTSGFLAENACNIVESQQFNDDLNQQFFMRVVFEPGPDRTVEQLRAAFGPLVVNQTRTVVFRD